MMTQKTARITNRKAYRDYHIEKTYEAGLQLKGDEVKSLRAGKGNLTGSFAKMENGEVFLHHMHINPYKYSQEEGDPVRPRKLLLHKLEIRQIDAKMSQRGYALVPLKVYFKGSHAKVEIGLGRGKNLYDKRRSLKEQQAKREVQREIGEKGKR